MACGTSVWQWRVALACGVWYGAGVALALALGAVSPPIPRIDRSCAHIARHRPLRICNAQSELGGYPFPAALGMPAQPREPADWALQRRQTRVARLSPRALAQVAHERRVEPHISCAGARSYIRKAPPGQRRWQRQSGRSNRRSNPEVEGSRDRGIERSRRGLAPLHDQMAPATKSTCWLEGTSKPTDCLLAILTRRLALTASYE